MASSTPPSVVVFVMAQSAGDRGDEGAEDDHSHQDHDHSEDASEMVLGFEGMRKGFLDGDQVSPKRMEKRPWMKSWWSM